MPGRDLKLLNAGTRTQVEKLETIVTMNSIVRAVQAILCRGAQRLALTR